METGTPLAASAGGTDEEEELFFTAIAANGQGIYRFEKSPDNRSPDD